MNRPKKFDIIFGVLLVVGVAASIVFGVPGIIAYGDKTLGSLICDIVPRVAVSVLLVLLIVRTEYKSALMPGVRGSSRAILWCLPCFAVAIVNFPFSALIRGTAVISRVDLLWLFIIKCLSIAVMEELFFRALLVPFAARRIGGKYRSLWAILLSAAIFGVVHFVNLFFGANIGATFLQVGYTFLIGCMLAVMLLVTRNVWLCVITHFVFDIGGLIVTDLGHGVFQDMTFWILTAVVGVVCAAYIVVTTVLMIKRQNAENATAERSPETFNDGNFDTPTDTDGTAGGDN